VTWARSDITIGVREVFLSLDYDLMKVYVSEKSA
jgi:hypothetical protein